MWFTVLDVFRAWDEGACPIDVPKDKRAVYWYNQSEVKEIWEYGNDFELILEDGGHILVTKFHQIYIGTEYRNTGFIPEE